VADEVVDLPDPEDAFDEKLIRDIRVHGWHAIHVSDEAHPEHAEQNAALAALDPDPIYDAAFSYTVGLTLSLDHPELVLVGRWQHAHGILAAAVSRIEEGVRFAPGDESAEVVESYPVRFCAVSPEQGETYLTYASWANRRRPFSALQIVVPDKDGRWPWEPGYTAYAQPLLR
jgi:hypothetical protein